MSEEHDKNVVPEKESLVFKEFRDAKPIFGSDDLTEKDRLKFAKQILLALLFCWTILLFSSFVSTLIGKQFIQLSHVILPVATLIIGYYFTK